MIARAITAIIGVVIGLFATFAVFSAILGGLDSFYLLTQDACNYGSLNSPKRALRIAPENSEHPRNADEIDWDQDGTSLVQAAILPEQCASRDRLVDNARYLTPTGDLFLVAPENDPYSLASQPDSNPWGIYADENVLWISESSPNQRLLAYHPDTGERIPSRDLSLPIDIDNPRGMFRHGDNLYIMNALQTQIYAYNYQSLSRDTSSEFHIITGNPAGNNDVWTDGEHVWFSDAGNLMAYDTSDFGADTFENIDLALNVHGFWVDGNIVYYTTANSDLIHRADISTSTPLALTPLPTTWDLPAQPRNLWYDGLYFYTFDVNNHLVHNSPYGEGELIDLPIRWIPAEDVFTAQEQLVTLLAVIAAIGMPIGAMTAIVFFGQAVLSSGMTGQGASQVLVAIAAVVIILVSIQMFQQFAGFLGTAFDAVNGDRFVVFDETLGSLAETIAEFWGVLAFAGFINIATIVWRNYSGNFSIGGNQGGL